MHKTLEKYYPDLAKQWHPIKNGDLKPKDISVSSSRDVWWICPKQCPEGCFHEWEARVSNRVQNNTGCGVCAGKRICEHMSIAYTHPEIAKQWHPTKNGDLKPTDFSAGSGRRVWWLCDKSCPEGCAHEWDSVIAGRTSKNYGCTWCSNTGVNSKMCEHMSITYTHPELVKQWHPTKNGELKPIDIIAGSGRKVWWLCDKSCPEGCPHEWYAVVNARSHRGDGCPHCTRKGKNTSYCEHQYLSYTHPELAEQWHPTKNGDLKPSNIMFGSEQDIWWLCPKVCPEGCPHEWIACVKSRSKGHGCAVCDRKVICEHMSIAYTHPEIAKQLHPTKNGDLKSTDIIAGSHDKVWWLCPKICPEGCPHVWNAVVKSRTLLNAGCAVCDRKVICEHISIAYTHPEIAKQWHPTKNGTLKPTQFTAGAHDKVWWLCPKITKGNKQHEWSSVIASRCCAGQGCNICKNKTAGKLFDYLIKLYPSLIKEFIVDSCKRVKSLPFDFCIPEIKTIIELDGAQHFRQVSNWKSAELTMKGDVFKMKKAIQDGYKVIRIYQEDVYSNNESWLEQNLLSEIKDINRTPVFISSIDTLYNIHIDLYESNMDLELNDI